MSKLFSTFNLGPMSLPNRLVMAPMTRCRAGEGNVPTDLMAEYYAQRASAGLLITEASQVCPEGIGYANTPGIHSEAQVAGWTKVTTAVHRAGGRIVIQLWHVGRISHPLFQPKGALPVAPSAIAPKGTVYTPQGPKPYEIPRALALEELPGIVNAYRQATLNAKKAGFDGVEIHGANGYLLDQFLRDGSNKRTDRYGGSVENRARLLLEVTDAAIQAWDKDHVGVRLSPGGTFNDMADSDTVGTFSYVIRELDRREVAFIHLRETTPDDVRHGGAHVPAVTFRSHTRRPIIVNAGYDKTRAEEVLSKGIAELVAFGVPFLANPDLPKRLEKNAPLNPPDTATFYGGSAKGYTDYPVLSTQN